MPSFLATSLGWVACAVWMSGTGLEAQTVQYGLHQQVFFGLSTTDNEYPASASFTNSVPSTNTYIANFNAASTAARGTGFGQRVRGFILPPVTGSYTFGIASDDWSDLYLSTDENPSGRRLIAFVRGLTAAANYEDQDSQTSEPVLLEGGRRYYIEVIHKQGSGSSHMTVRWQLPDESIEAPIASRPTGKAPRLLPYQTNTLTAAQFINPPTNTTAVAGRPARFSVLMANQATMKYQWQREGVDLPGATQSVLTIASASLAEMNGKKFRCVVSNDLGAVNSAEATLTVTPDTLIPGLVSALPLGRDRLLVTFSEDVLGQTAQASQFALSGGANVLGVSLPVSASQLILSTTTLQAGASYTLTVGGVQDLAGNPVPQGTSLSFRVEEGYTASVGATNSLGSVITGANSVEMSVQAADIGARGDQFLFQYTLLSGDFDYKVRVESMSNSDILAKAGLMARDDLSRTSRFAGVFSTPSINGVNFLSRGVAGRDAVAAGTAPMNFPDTWVRLTREGNVFKGYSSTDGANWAQLGAATIAMPEFVYLGLAATSRDTNEVMVTTLKDFVSAAGEPLGTPGSALREPPGPSTRRGGLVISEIMYHPADRADKRNLEFVEIFNSQPFFEDISGYRVAGDIDFTFPANTRIEAGAYVVVAKVPDDLKAVYSSLGRVQVFGPYSNNIPNDLGRIVLLNEIGGIFQEVNYRSDMPWPVAGDGTGHSIVLARPSYGENEVKGWASSDRKGGSPGAFDGAGAEPLRNVVINEWMANPAIGQEEFIELYNHSAAAVDLSGAWLSDNAGTNKFRIPNGTSIQANGFVRFTALELGFSLSSGGESIFLVNPSNTRVVDAVKFQGQSLGVSSGRIPNGWSTIGELETSSPGASNAKEKVRPIVVNEIMFSPITGDNDDEFIEFYNRGSETVSLAGWKIADAVSYTFPVGATIPAGGYVVVGKSLTRLLASYSNLSIENAFGNYGGTLGNSGDRIQVLMPENVVGTNALGVLETNLVHVLVDEVAYRDGGRWGKWADGGGSSLELKDANADNRQPSNWADSDETKKASWTTVNQTALLDNGQMASPTQLHMFLQNAGEALVDNVEVYQVGKTNNLTAANGGFQNGTTGWTFQGTHEETTGEAAEGYESTKSLHVRASARGDNGGNRIRTALSPALAASGQATIKAKVRWLAGTPHMLFRIYGNFMEAPVVMDVPKNLGTPGAANSRRVNNMGPAIHSVVHSPILPAAGEGVTVTARATDPSGVKLMLLNWQVDSTSTTTFTSVPMKDDGVKPDAIAGDGIYAASIPGQASGVMVAFYIAAIDSAAPQASTTFPPTAPAEKALVRFGENQLGGNLAAYRIWVTAAVKSRWDQRGKQSNHPLDCTFVYNNYRAIYNGETLYSGSPWHTPGFSGPLGSICDYVYHAPADDQLLGSTDFVLASIGNTDNDPTKLAEQSSYWIARKMGVPYNYRRFFRMYFNGVLRAPVYEDTQQPNGEVIEQYYTGDTDGPLHKIEDWFEFDDSGDNKSGNVDATLGLFLSGDEKKVARYRVCWRPRNVGPGESPNDFTELFKAVDALNAPNPDLYVSAVNDIIDVDHWFRILGVEHIVGNWDSYGYNRGKNMYAYKPSQSGWKLLMWDIDFDLGSGGDGPTTDLFTTTEPVITRLFANPRFRRQYLRICQEAAESALLASEFNPMIDAKFRSLVDNGAAPAAVTGIKDFVNQRRNYILNTAVPKTTFDVLSTNFQQTAQNFITITGQAPVKVESLRINGQVVNASWFTLRSLPIGWSVQLPLSVGTNQFTIEGLDSQGNVYSNIVEQVSVVSTAQVVVPEGQVVINEISFDPTARDAAYVEIYNRHATAAFDLTGWRLAGVDFNFPDGYLLLPGQYVVAAKDRFAYGDRFGFRYPLVGEFQGNLDPEGETLSLLRPSGTDTNTMVVVDQVHYEARTPWPAGPTTVQKSIELVDAGQDNARVSNWSDGGTGWKQVVTTGKAGGSNLFLYITTPASSAYVDKLSLVAGEVAEAGENLIRNGDFESPLAGSGFRVGTNYNASALASDVVYSGNTSLMIAGAAAGALTGNGAIVQSNLPVVINNTYTLSYWMRYGTGSGNLIVRLNPGNGLASTQTVTRALGTPTTQNSSVGSLPAFPTVWLNEVGPFNETGLADSQGERDPWVELYNAGSAPQDLTGYYLSDNYTNLNAWAFPAGTLIQPGQFLVVWVDGDPGDSKPGELHTSFRIQPSSGSVALSRTLGQGIQILDYLNYESLDKDESYGSYPDGQPFDRVVFAFATPGAKNNNASRPVSVKINEWMASNTGFILDPADNQADDWFELYNPGTTAADLSGYFLTDTLTQPTQFRIPTGTVIPAKGYLLVWADNNADQNGTNSVDLHANFQLSRQGESIGLFAPDGSTIDTVTFGSQTNNVSQGRFPDGSPSIAYFANPTPRAANRLSGANTAPSILPVADQVVNEGARVLLQLAATDLEEGADQLVFSLAPGAPAGMSVTPRGLVRWRASEAQGPATYTVTFRVNDNGTPSLQGTLAVNFTVREVNLAPTFLDPRPRFVKVGQLLEFGTAVDRDLPAQTLSYRIEGAAPQGLVLNPTTGVISWTPVTGQADQSYPVTVVATDSGVPVLSSANTYTISVLAADATLIVLNAAIDAGQVNLSWQSVSGASYQVEYRDDVTSAWQSLGAPVSSVGGSATVRDPVKSSGMRLYRVRQL